MMMFIGICFAAWIIAFSYIVIMAIRRPSEFKEAVNSILDDLLDI